MTELSLLVKVTLVLVTSLAVTSYAPAPIY